MKTISKKKIGKSALSLVLVMLMLFSVIPFSASAANGNTSSNTGNTASPYPYTDQKDPTGDYPSASEEGYVQLTKSAAWSKDGTETNLDTDKEQGYISLSTYGTPIGGDAGVNVLLIMDTSGSMGNPVTGSDGVSYVRNTLLKSTGLVFLDVIFEEATGVANNNRVGILPFNSSAITSGSGFTNFTGINGRSTLEQGIKNLPASGGTSFTAPLIYAKTMISNDITTTGNSAENYVILFMTDGEAGDATAEAKALKDMGVTIYSIGMGNSTNIAANYQTILKNIASVVDGNTLFFMEDTEAGFRAIYENIGGELKLAATDVTITDTINTDKFEYDGSRSFLIDGNPITAADDVTISGNKVTWKLDTVSSSAKTLQIPIKVKNDWNGIAYTNADVGDRSKIDDRAIIEYINYQNNPSRKSVESPTLARPWAGVTVVYFAVDANGNALDDSGSASSITDQDSFDARHHSVYTESFIQAMNTSEIYTALQTMRGNDGNYYEYVSGAKYAQVSPYELDIKDDNEQHKIFFGVKKIDPKEITLSKEYNPPLPEDDNPPILAYASGSVAPSVFTFTNMDDPTDYITWDAVGTGSISLAPQVIYKVTEQAAVGYKKIADFYVQYDPMTNTLNIVTATGAPASEPANVTKNGFSLDFVNEKDTTETKEVSYQVEYFTTDGELTNVETVTENIWIHDTEIPVNAGKIDLTNRFNGYKCDITAVDLPATVPEQGGLVRVPHSADTSVTRKESYYVEYYKDGNLTYRDTVTEEVWIGATHMDVDVSAINVTDYYGAGYAFDKTDPTSIPSSIEFGKTISVYYVTDTGDTKPLTYHVEYYIDGDYVKTETYPISIWAGANTYEVTKADLEPFTGYRLQRTYPDLPYGVSDGETIEAYYVKDSGAVDQITYTFKYVDENGTELASPVPNTQTVWIGSPYVTVSTTDVKSITGYILKEVQLNSATNIITLPNNTITDGDIITFVYRTDPNATEEVTIKVAYYKAADHTTPAATENKKVTVKIGQKYNLAQSEVDTNKFAGEKIDSSKTSFPIAVGAGETAHIYFMIDASQLKTITYRIEHYLDDELQPNDTITVTDSSVPATSNTIAVTDTTQTYAGYRRITEALNGQAADGDVFKVYYLRDLSITGPVSYTIRYYYAVWSLPDIYTHNASMDEIITKEAWIGATEVDVLASELPDVTKPLEVGSETWILNTQKTIIPLKVEAGGYVDLFYIVKADVSIDIDGKTTYTSKMKAGDFDFEMVDKNGIQVAFGSNNAAGQIVLNLTVPLDSSVVIGSIDEYVVRYTGTGNANPLRPDTTEYIVQAQVVLNSSGIPTLKVTHYNKQIAFAMR